MLQTKLFQQVRGLDDQPRDCNYKVGCPEVRPDGLLDPDEVSQGGRLFRADTTANPGLDVDHQ